MLFNFFKYLKLIFEILSFSPMQICFFSGIVKNRRIFAGKSLFFNKNEKTSQLFLKLPILFQIQIYNNLTFLGSINIMERDCTFNHFFR